MSRVADVVEHRVEANLAAMRATLLVDLPADRSFTYDEFTAAQQRHQARAAAALAVRNEEVARAVDDAVALVRAHPRENAEACRLDEREVELFRGCHSNATYRAILAAVQRSFAAIKRRVGSSTATGVFFLERPFFDASVELRVPHVAVTPTLEAIQGAVDAAAKAILEATKQLRCWGQGPGGPATYHELIARDKEVVKSVLLLTGSVEGVKSQVAEFLAGFDRYKFLWTQDLQAAYDAFTRAKPTLEAFEAELRKYNALEQEIAAVPALHNIGSLSLETAPLKASLRSGAAGWKAQFAQNLHRQCAEDLRAFDAYIRDATLRLSSNKAADLEDVMALVAALDDVRGREADVDGVIGPIEEMYALLARYEVREGLTEGGERSGREEERGGGRLEEGGCCCCCESEEGEGGTAGLAARCGCEGGCWWWCAPAAVAPGSLHTSLLTHNNKNKKVRVPKEEAALVSDLRYGWRKLRKLAGDVADSLARLQAGFRRDLVKEVRAFVVDAKALRRDWDAAGPMVPGLDPLEAMDRLRKFQQMFEVRKRKWDNCSAGEVLFGLPVTQFPELEQTEKEVREGEREGESESLGALIASLWAVGRGKGGFVC